MKGLAMSVDFERVQRALAGRYVVECALGHGAMAAVFRGREPSSGWQVAIKVLRPEFATTLLGDRFHREIAFLSRLDHPNILPVLDSGTVGTIVYYAMPFAGGGSLRSRLDETRQLDLDETLAVSRDVAAALDHAHANNIVHRDIKPANILFEPDRAVICDFGVARAIIAAAGESISTSGLVVGTPAYMSPEQASGEADLDARSDIYSLACVVYEMLAGEPPFTGRTAQAIMARQVRERPPSLHVVRPDLPDHVERTMQCALAKARDARPATAGELIARLSAPS